MKKEMSKFEVFFDGDCPLCKKEIAMIEKMDRHQKMIFTDISGESFVAERDTGVSFNTLMDEIHGRHEDGTLVKGVEVFRQLYSRTALSWLVPVTRVWGVRQGLDLVYSFFAKNRLRFTGRCRDNVCSISGQAQTQ